MKKFFHFIVYLLITLVLGTTFAFILFNLPVGKPASEVKFGMTYSYRYAEALGLDPQETLTAQLQDLGIREWRIPVYWDLVEPTQGSPDYAWVDWQLSEIEKYNGRVILSLGQRVPRWPECHIPAWAQENEALKQEALLKHIERTVKRYQDRESIVMWQVENEPFLTQFGECPPLDKKYLEAEIALVKSLDSRPILVTDSGELSLWVRAAKRGDVFGTTLYRHIYTHHFGGRYITYPIGPSFFHIKTLLVKLLTDQKNFLVIELQAEPWAPGWLVEYPLEEQFKTMDETKLRENVDYAKRLGFPEICFPLGKQEKGSGKNLVFPGAESSEVRALRTDGSQINTSDQCIGSIYLWGGEWWYWLKEKKGYSGLWEEGKLIFRDER